MNLSITKSAGIGIAILLVGIVIGKFFFSSGSKLQEQHSATGSTSIEQVWTCAMHPQIRQGEPGSCPICGMDLVPVGSGNDEGELESHMFQMSENAVQLANVQTSAVTRGSIDQLLSLQGIVQEDERSISLVTSRFDGRLDKLEVNFTGASVNEGDVLASIYSPKLVTAQRELLEAKKNESSNPKLYQAAKAKLKLWDLSERQITSIENGGEPVEHIDIISPISGIVTNRLATLGEYVKEGTVLFHVTDLRKVWLLFDAYEADIPFLKVGTSLSFTINSIPGRKFNASVSFIDPILNTTTRTAAVRVEMDNHGLLLKPGMFAEASVSVSSSNSNALLIPNTSVLWTGKRSVVYVRVPDTEVPVFAFREVLLGSDLNGFYEVKEGLAEGEMVVTNGTFKLDAAAQLAGKKSMMNQVTIDSHKSDNHQTRPESTSMNELSFTVFGNCGMCRKRIENAAMSVSGVMHANWNSDTKRIVIHTEHQEISSETISLAVAKVGHDTEFHQADDDTYDDLPGCCQFERPEESVQNTSPNHLE